MEVDTLRRTEQELSLKTAERVVGWWASTPDEYRSLVRSDAYALAIVALRENGFDAGPVKVLSDSVDMAIDTIDRISLITALNKIADDRVARGELD